MSEQNSGEQPPRPRYGEYAPPGWTPPQQEQPAPPAPPAPPTAPGWGGQPYGGQQAGGSAGIPQPGAAHSGQYAPPAGWGDPAVPVKKRNTVDLVFTIILLGIGLFGAGYGVLVGLGTADPDILNRQLRETYGGNPNLTAGAWPAVIIVSHLVLYLAALGLSILSLVRRRITFWIPLVAGVVAFLIFVIALFAIIFSDPTYVEQLGVR